MTKPFIRRIQILVMALGLAGLVPTQMPSSTVQMLTSPAPAVAQDAPKPDVDVKIDVGHGGGVWYANPTILLFGGGVLIVVLAFIALAARGGGTTIIREK